MSNQAQQPQTLMGSLTGTAMRGLKMIDRTFQAVEQGVGAVERITYIAESKASNLAEISDVADTFKLVVAKKELKDKMDEYEALIESLRMEVNGLSKKSTQTKNPLVKHKNS